MRVVIAPDKFAGTLSAREAAKAIAVGWHRAAPDDLLHLAPMSDGGPGFVEVLAAALEGEVHLVSVPGTYGEPATVSILIADGVAYIESAQACGLALTDRREPTLGTSYGVGAAMVAAVEYPITKIIIGLGGTGTNDGGTGMLAALGATANVPLHEGPLALTGMSHIDISAAKAKLGDVAIEIAADVQVPLLGMFGASKTFGPQKGLTDAEIIEIDGILDNYVNVLCGSSPSERAIADSKGAGAAGGIGFALLALGGTVVSGIDIVAKATQIERRIAQSELVVTGEGAFDFSSRTGKVVYGIAQIAERTARPCIVVAAASTSARAKCAP
jgi:glycerate kinase